MKIKRLFFVFAVLALISLSFLTISPLHAAVNSWLDDFSDQTKVTNTTGVTFKNGAITLSAKTPGSITQTTKEEFLTGTISTQASDAATPPNTNIPTLEILKRNDGEIRIANQILWQYGTTGVSAQGFNSIRGNAYTTRQLANGNILIPSQENRVIEVDKDKNIVWQYGASDRSYGTGVNRLYWPYNAIRNSVGNTVISDYANERIVEIKTSDYNPALPDLGYTAASIVHACSIPGFISAETLPDDTVLATIRGQRFIAIYNLSNCQVLWRYGDGSSGTGINQLLYPHQPIALRNGNFLVVDKSMPKIFELRKDDYNATALNYGFTTSSILWEYGGSAGTGINQLNSLEYATETNDGNIIVADRWSYKVYIIKKSDYVKGATNNGFTSQSIIWQYGDGTLGTTAGHLAGLLSARQLTDGSILITDQGNYRVIIVGYPLNQPAIYTSAQLNGGDANSNKKFTEIKFETDPLPANSSIEVLYSIDNQTFETLGTETTQGSTTHVLQLPESAIGKSIKYQLKLLTNAHDQSPTITSVTVSYDTFDIPAQWDVNTNSQLNAGNRNGTTIVDEQKVTLESNWVKLSSANTLLYNAATVVYNNKIYAFGGCGVVNGVTTYFNNTRYFDPQTNSWTELAPFVTGRCSPKVYVIGSKAYLLGGSGATTTLEVQEYDFNANTWRTMASFANRGSGVFAEVNGKIYIIGGYASVYFDDIQEFNPTAGANGTWVTKTAKLPTKSYQIASVVYNQKIYMFGGYTGSSSLNSVLEYNPATDTISSKTPLNTARYAAMAYVQGSTVYLAGGVGATYLNDFQSYDILTDTWSPLTVMPSALYNGIMTIADSDHIAIFGGYTGTKYLLTPFIYTISTNSWKVLDSSPANANYGYTIKLLNGTFYQLGGYVNGIGYSDQVYSFNGYKTTGTWTTQQFDAGLPNAYKLFSDISWTVESNTETPIELFYKCDNQAFISLRTTGSATLPSGTACKTLTLQASFTRGSDIWKSDSLVTIATKYLMYGDQGVVESTQVSRPSDMLWKTFKAGESYAPNTTILYSFYGANNQAIPNFQNLHTSSGEISLSKIPATIPIISVKAQLITTNNAYTPMLDSWEVSWKAKPVITSANDTAITPSVTPTITDPLEVTPPITEIPQKSNTLLILDQNNQPLTNKEITLNNENYLTDENGRIEIHFPIVKGQRVTISYKNTVYEGVILGESTGEKRVQLTDKKTNKPQSIPLSLVLPCSLFVIIVIFIILLKKRNDDEEKNKHRHKSRGSPVTE